MPIELQEYVTQHTKLSQVGFYERRTYRKLSVYALETLTLGTCSHEAD